VEAIAAWA